MRAAQHGVCLLQAWDGFRRYFNDLNINLDGVNITYGTQHHLIWSYIYIMLLVWLRTVQNSHQTTVHVSKPYREVDLQHPLETGIIANQATQWTPLWKIISIMMIPYGMTSSVKVPVTLVPTQSPPWFSVQLPAATTESDVVNLSICSDNSTFNEDTPIVLLEIYAQ